VIVAAQKAGKTGARDVRVVIGVPCYNGLQTGHLEGAAASLLAQTYRQVAFIFIDDGPSEGALDAIASLAAGVRDVHLERNAHRRGLVRNWRAAFDRARELYPKAPYFAWGSDHDRWHPDWLAKLVAELDAHPDAVLAYPRFVRINDRDEEISRAWPLSPRREFLSPKNQKVGAGNLVYGLYRSVMLARADGYPMVYRPDVYLLMELSLYGQIRLVPETLWYRRERPHRVSEDGARAPRKPREDDAARDAKPSGVWERAVRSVGIGPVSRQHRSTFPGAVPLYARLPAHVQHAALMFWRLTVFGRGKPLVSRRLGLVQAARVLRSSP
jgi:glycosyltransferase involved in cell wall biosynthesis